MKIKQLVWRDNITKFGKKEGLVEIVSKVDTLDLRYKIRNHKNNFDKLPIPLFCKYYSFAYYCGDEVIFKKTNDIEKAKELAQKHFEKVVMETFFEKD